MSTNSSHVKQTLDNLEFRLAEKDQTQSKIPKAETVSVIPAQSLNDLDNESVAKRRSALLFWKQSRLKRQKLDEKQANTGGCTFLTQLGNLDRKVKEIEPGNEMQFLSGEDRFLHSHNVIKNFVTRNLETGYQKPTKKEGFGFKVALSVGITDTDKLT